MESAKYLLLKGTDVVYKYLSEKNYLLKISPWISCEDRRVFDFDITNYKKINSSNALEIANNQWNKEIRDWEFNGEKYRVFDSISTDFRYTYMNRYSDMNPHKFLSIYSGFGGAEYKYIDTYYLCMFRGKLYWALLSQYYPRIQLYKFIDFDTTPKFKDFVQWTHAKNCKKVYKLNKEVEVYEVV